MLEAWLWDQREEGREASTNKVKYGLEDMAKAIKEGKKKRAKRSKGSSLTGKRQDK